LTNTKKTAPIGVFDSGVGGLTVAREIMRNLPKEDIVYFGDTARTPYGSKAASTIRSFSIQIADFLVQNDVKMLVIACNTISATCLEDLQFRYPEIPVIGIIGPAAERTAKICSIDNKVGIIGTKATIQSQAYDTLLREYKPELQI